MLTTIVFNLINKFNSRKKPRQILSEIHTIPVFATGVVVDNN